MRAMWLAGAGLLLAGCAKVTVPDVGVYIGPSMPPPPAYVAPANPNSPADLSRENQQLRDRLAWVEYQNPRLDRKKASLDRDAAELRAEISRLSAERDSYKASAGVKP